MATNILQIKRTSVSGRAANTTTITNPGELGLNMTDGIMYSTNGSVVFEIGANLTSIAVGNSSQRFTANTTGAFAPAVFATGAVNAASHTVGTAVIANTTGVFTTGTANASVLSVGANVIANTTQVTSNVNMLINNNKQLRFQTVNTSAYAYFVQQSDDNFVFYTSNTTYGQRAVWSVFANSITSTMRMDVPIYPIAGITANGAIGTAGQVLKSNGAGIFWDTSGGTGTVTSVATGNGLTGGTITSTGTLSVTGGSTLTVNTTGVHVNSSLSLDRILTSNNGAGTNMAVGDDAWFGDINTADTVSIRGQQSANNGYIVFGNADTTTKLGRTGAGPLAYNGDFAATGSVNAASHTVGTAFVANTTRVAIGTTVGLQANGGIGTAGQVLTSNATTVYWSTPTTGTVTQVSSGNGLTGGPITSTGTLSVVAGNGTIISNATGVYVNASALSIATSQLTGDVALGTSTSGNYVATITAGNGISGSSSAEGGTPTIAVVAGSGIASNATGVHVVAGNGTIISNATGVYVNASALSIATSQLTGDVALGTSTSGNYVATISNANGISGSSSAEGGAPTIGVVTGSTLTVNTTGIHVNSALSIASLGLTGDLTVSGNLTVSGTRTYVNTTTLDIGDNIFTLNADLGAVAPSQDAGMEIMRGTSANVQFMWDETNDRWSTNGQPLAVSSLVAAGAASGITTLAAGNTTITGFANVSTTLQVGTNTATFGTAAYIVANGNVGIGTSTPTFRFQVETDTDANAGTFIRNSNTGTTAAGTISVNSLVGSISMRAHSAAHGAWPNSTLISSDTGFTGGLNLAQVGANPIRLWTNGSERMRIDAGGNVMVGTTATNNRFLVTYSNPVSVPSAGAGGHGIAIGTVGYGLAGGVRTDGSAYLQSTRWDGTATNYSLLLQPNGGSIGVGVTPLAWNSDYTVVQIGAAGSIAGRVGGSNTLDITSNGYRGADGSWKYSTAQSTARFTVDGSVPGFQWYTAETGTVGANITFTQAMTLNNTGLGIGNTSPAHKLSVDGTIAGGNTTITGFANVTSTLQVGGVASFGANVAMANNNVINPVLTGYTEAEVANAATSGTFTMNCLAANFFDLTLTGNTTISPSNVPPNTRVWSGSIAAKQDATGGRTITWPAGTKYAGGVAPPATTTANALDIWSLMTYDGGSTWIVSLSVKGVA